jgi:cell division septum initiation protein DivIVA
MEGQTTARVRGYDPAAVAALLDLAAAERERLRAALAAANDRISAARLRLVATQDVRDRLAAMVLDAERRHRKLDDEVSGAVQRMLEAAEAESVALAAAAHADVARRLLANSMRQVADADSGPAPAGHELNGHHISQVS